VASASINGAAATGDVRGGRLRHGIRETKGGGTREKPHGGGSSDEPVLIGQLVAGEEWGPMAKCGATQTGESQCRTRR